MRRILLSAACLAVVHLPCMAEDIGLSVAGFVQTPDAEANAIVVQTVRTTGAFPLPEYAYPAFWLDCTRTNGWVFAGSGVTKIPSLVGTRYLTTTELVSWTGWGSGSYPPLPPEYLASDPTLGGRPALDFGTLGSMRGMLFDAHEYESGASTNILEGIGSIVVVYGSQNGGGWLMGGGPDTWTGNADKSYAWHRAYSYVLGSNQFSYDSPLFVAYGYAAPFNKGARHDGMQTSPYAVGFNRSWEVIALPSQAADAAATGIGLGDTRSGKRWYSGGMKIAELMLFDRILSTDEIVALEVWLQKKWFDRTVEGFDGNARVSRLLARTNGNGSTTVLNVPADEALTVGRLDGVRGKDAVVAKEGAGRLDIKDATGFAGSLRLSEGKIGFEKRPVPSLSSLPDSYLHFDATDGSSVVTETRGDAEYVARWDDLAGGKVTQKSVFLVQSAAAQQPTIVRDAMGEGLHMVDFRSVSAGDAACMRFMKGSPADAAEATLGSISTVVAVMGAQRGGGRVVLLGGSAFHRADEDFSASTYGPSLPILSPRTIEAGMGVSATNGTAWVDGLKKGPLEGFDTPGYQVVALKVPAYDVKYFGADNSGGAAGGFRVGEVFVYNRILSDREIEDVQAYLMNRWFGREAPGYAKTSARAEIPDVQSLDVDGVAAIDVAAGADMRVGSLEVESSLTISGDGALCAESLSAAGRIALDGATLKTVPPPSTGESELAAGAVLHLDAADASSIETTEVNGTNFVARWHSKDYRNAAYLAGRYAANRPWLNDDKAVNGSAVVDFGGPIGHGAFLALEKSLDSIRDVYVVLDGEKGGGFLFGSRGGLKNNSGDEAPNYYQRPSPEVTGDFYPDTWSSSLKLLTGTFSPVFTSGGSVLTNGVVVNPVATPFPESATLLEYHGNGAATASWIGADKPQQQAGGFRIAELVAYDRTLTPRERVATRNHLMAKWLNAQAEQLPEDVRSSSLSVVSGEGALVKADGGTLSVGDLGSFTGAVSVASGTLALAKAPAAVAPRLATSGRIAHFDASEASTVTAVDMDGYTGFSEWRSLVGGWKAVPISKYLPDLATGTARIMRHSLNGRDTFLLGDANSPMLFEDSQGVTNEISGIRSVFWVLGTVNGMCGGYILGGGSPLRNGTLCPWMRPDAAKSDPAQPIIADGYASGYVNYDNFCTWHLDGMTIKPNVTGYQSDAWHVVDIAIKSTVATPPTAGGFAYDNRIILQSNGWNDFKKYSGNQNLAEVIFYDHVLSESERLGVEAYLQVKWGLRSGEPRDVSFAVAAGSTLDLGGATRTVGGISGSGSVVNGSLAVSSLTADAAATEVPSVSGSVVLASGVVVELKNLTPEVAEIPVLRATSVSGSFGEAVFTGECPPDGVRPRLRFRDGLLFVRIPYSGFAIILR